MDSKKKLYRSSTDYYFGGVCGGLADYFGIDSTIVRVIYVALSLFSSGFPGLILYLVLMFIIPSDDEIVGDED